MKALSVCADLIVSVCLFVLCDVVCVTMLDVSRELGIILPPLYRNRRIMLILFSTEWCGFTISLAEFLGLFRL